MSNLKLSFIGLVTTFFKCCTFKMDFGSLKMKGTVNISTKLNVVRLHTMQPHSPFSKLIDFIFQ